MSEQKKEAVEQALADLSDKADDCSRLAKLQRDGADKQQASADKQHENAHKLEKLGSELEQDVVEIKRALTEVSDPTKS